MHLDILLSGINQSQKTSPVKTSKQFFVFPKRVIHSSLQKSQGATATIPLTINIQNKIWTCHIRGEFTQNGLDYV